MLDNAKFLAGLKDCQEKEEATKTKKEHKKHKIIVTNTKKVKEAREIHGHGSASKFNFWKFDKCGAYLQYKRISEILPWPRMLREEGNVAWR